MTSAGPVPPPPGSEPDKVAGGWQWTQPLPTSIPPPPGAGWPVPGNPPPMTAMPLAATGQVDRRRGPGWGIAATLAGVAAVGGGVIGGLASSTVRPEAVTGTTAVAGAAVGTSQRPSDTIAGIAARAVPSVVTVKVGGGTGSGWIYDTTGHIITNNHVIDSAARAGSIKVQFADGRTGNATLVGRDASYDIAVLKADIGKAKPLPVGSSSKVVVGDQVIAVGAPLGLESTVTSGIVSALERPVSAGRGNQASFIDAIQTDAAINPGNSGGPLLDSAGQVIGVNSAIAQVPNSASVGQGGNIGVGFAIASDQVRKTADQIIKDGKAVHPVIGVSLDMSWQGAGARVMTNSEARGSAVSPKGPAAKAGIQPGDVVIKFNGKPITSPEQLVVMIRARNVGEQVKLTVSRAGSTRDVTMTLEAAQD